MHAGRSASRSPVPSVLQARSPGCPAGPQRLLTNGALSGPGLHLAFFILLPRAGDKAMGGAKVPRSLTGGTGTSQQRGHSTSAAHASPDVSGQRWPGHEGGAACAGCWEDEAWAGLWSRGAREVSCEVLCKDHVPGIHTQPAPWQIQAGSAGRPAPSAAPSGSAPRASRARWFSSLAGPHFLG